MLFDGSLLGLGLDGKDWNVLFLGMGLLLGVDLLRMKKISLPQLYVKQNLVFRWLVVLAGVCAVLLLGAYGAEYNAAQFIYFQF